MGIVTLLHPLVKDCCFNKLSPQCFWLTWVSYVFRVKEVNPQANPYRERVKFFLENRGNVYFVFYCKHFLLIEVYKYLRVFLCKEILIDITFFGRLLNKIALIFLYCTKYISYL